MKVRELIETLEAYDPERLVVMAKDAEGNDYSPLCDAWAGKYRAETTCHGRVGIEELNDILKQQGYSDEDVLADGEPALILRPVD